MQLETHFDYIIIGNGLAGLQLAMGFADDPFFDSYTIALIDPSTKSSNDKTWSFWEKKKGQWDHIVENSWNTALFKSNKELLTLPLGSYQYKSIRSLDFYNEAKEKLSLKSNFQFILDSVDSVQGEENALIIGKERSYTSNHVFDSRIPNEFFKKQETYTVIHQHFKGWVVETKEACFDPNAFVMMDYRFQHEASTSFIYVLPFSKTKALIEYTFFTPFITEEFVYDTAIKKYITEELRLEDYTLLETEFGNIPMTDFPFWKFNTDQITKIGTGGGWVKGSTGYSFKHTEKYVSKIIKNIKKGQVPSKDLFNKKFRFYDTIFLKVLKNENEKGVWIFERFYSKNTIHTMFRFLDEETSFNEDLKIMMSLFSTSFIKAFFKVLFRF